VAERPARKTNELVTMSKAPYDTCNVVSLMFLVSTARLIEQVLRFRIGCLNSELILEFILFLSLK